MRALAIIGATQLHWARAMSTQRLTWLATVLYFIGYYALNIPVPLYLKSIGIADGVVGLILGANVAASLLTRPFAGGLADAWGRKPVMLLGAAALVLGAAGFGLATAPPLLFVLRLMQIVGYVMFTTASTALAADLAAPDKRGAAIAMMGSGANLAMTFTPLLMSLLLGWVSLPLSFGVPALMALVAAVAMMRVAEPDRAMPANGGALAVARELFALFIPMRRPLITIVLMGMAWGTFFQFTPLLAQRNGLASAGLIYTLYGSVMLSSRLTLGRKLDQLPRMALFVSGFISLALGLFVLGTAHGMPQALLGIVLIGLPSGLLHPLLGLMHVELANASQRGRASSVYFMGWDIGIGGGAIALAPVLEAYDVEGQFVGAAVFALAALVPAVLAVRQAPRLARV
jgi:MFS family permease